MNRQDVTIIRAGSTGRRKDTLTKFAFLLCAVLIASTHDAFAQIVMQSAGTTVLVQGAVILTDSSGNRHPIAIGGFINPGDTIDTGTNGELHVKMEDGGYLAVRPNTLVKIDAYSANGDATDNSAILLIRGALRSVTGWIGKLNAKRYRITTPTATIGIRGTDHETIYIEEGEAKPGEVPGTHDLVHHGATFLENAEGRVEIPEGRAGYAPTMVNQLPALHTFIPKFLNQRRTSNDQLVDKHYAEIEKRIEEKLREHGILHDGEKYKEYISRIKETRENAEVKGRTSVIEHEKKQIKHRKK